MKTVLAHGKILPGDGNWKPIEDGYLVIEDERIVAIGSGEPPADAGTIRDCSDCVILPGFYNMHTHTPMSTLRGIGSGLTLQEWLFDRIFPLEAKLNPDDKRVACRLAIAEMVAGGVVSFSDMYHHAEQYAVEVLDSGIKANLSFPLMDNNPTKTQSHNDRFASSVAFFNDFNGLGDGRLLADLGIHAEYTNTAEGMQRYGEICKQVGARMQLHLSETASEHAGCIEKYGKTPAQLFNDLGVFDSPTIAAHCVFAEPSDLEIFKEKGVFPVHNLSSNLKLGSGLMPIRDMLDLGIRVTIGTDSSASNNNQNLFEEIHLASMVHSGFHRNPTLLQPGELLDIATINGALAQGRADCGALKVGNYADLMIVSLDKPHMKPDHDTAALLVYSAQASDVQATMINGRFVYDRGEWLTIDREKLDADLAASVQRVFSK